MLDGRKFISNSVWLCPPLLQIVTKYLVENYGYSDGGQRGDDRVTRGVGATHQRSGRAWIGGPDQAKGGIEPMDSMWRFF